jgi:glutaconate CoA-transferase, subunit A
LISSALRRPIESRSQTLVSKLVTLEEAVSKFTTDGDMIGFASSAGKMSVAFAYEIIKQKRKNLKFVSAGTGAPCLDLLVGAKAVTCAEASFTMVSCHNIRRAIESTEHSAEGSHRLMLEDYSNLAMTLRFVAAAMKIPFIPIRSLRGSDLERLRTFMGDQKLAVMKSPFKDRSEVTVLPPCTPDVAVMHAQFADEAGNVLAYGPAGSDGWALKAAKRRVVTVEKVVTPSFAKENRNQVFLPGFLVDAVCEVPYGAHPYGLFDYYDLDEAFQKTYNEMSKTQGGFDAWADDWIFGVRSRKEYLDRVGRGRLKKITTGGLASVARAR